ncbi:MAG: hypothetical protein P4L84_27625 [Isosphaeraceae bacterium]|nr:hypothetical protein [Isosphaeraceae bacterium]
MSGSIRGRSARWQAALLASLFLGLATVRASFGQAPAPMVSPAGQRLAQILDEMDVEHHWLPGEGIRWKTGEPDPKSHQHATHCSAFAAAACDRLGAYLLRPPEHSQVLLANAQYEWLGREGLERGWRRIRSRSEAQVLANDGWAVVCVFRNPDRHKPGHIAVVRPSLRSAEDVEHDGPQTAMAGRHNASSIPMRSAFKSHPEAFDAGEILMFAHESPVTRSPPAASGKEGPRRPPPAPRETRPAAPAGQAAEGTEAPPRPLAEVLAANLPAWTGGTGVVEKHRLQALANDPRIRGENGAALAALLRQFKKAPFTSLPAASLDTQEPAKAKLEHDYRTAVEKLGKVERSLFAGGRPNFEKMRQGPAGDCYLFSGAGWWAYFHPERLVEMIRPLSDGRFHVRFPDGEQAVVTPPTDTELAYNESSSTVGDGLWMAVLEKVVGTLDVNRDSKTRDVLDPSLRVNIGGSARVDVHRWTGHPVETFHLHERAQHARVRDALIAMQRQRLMAQAVVPRADPPAGPLPGNHVYAILGFDPETNALTVWNPWGDDFTPKGPEGLQHGWPRHHGVFQIPFADFVRVFSTLNIERR